MQKLAIVVVLSLAFPARAEELDMQTRTELAQVLVGEADGSRTDWAAILWTLRHRQALGNRELAAVARYSTILRVDTPRAVAMRTLGTEAPDWGTLGERRRKQWEAALLFVDKWASGSVPDPCPKSLHWGGVRDKKPAGRTTVVCGGPTLNEFFFVGRIKWETAGNAKTFIGATTPSQVKISTTPSRSN